VSLKKTIQEGIESIILSVSRSLFKNLVAIISFACIGLVPTLLNKVFDIDAGNTIIIATISAACIYIAYKIVKFSTAKKEKIENQTLWDELEISQEIRHELIEYITSFLVVLLLLVLYIILIKILFQFFTAHQSLIISTIIVVSIPICYKFNLHIKLYQFINRNSKHQTAVIVCKNCATLISKSDSVCFNCGTKVKKSKAPIFFLSAIVVGFAIFIYIF
jgi:hypothetical protein